uniref:DDE Tnp4 domain-containing protein n=1 Tax=Amphiprion ocellaris TaxID=80972 RepID=A0A3Q1BZU4_AMPOC
EDKRIQTRRRTRMALLLRNYRCKPSVWAFNQASLWWDFIVPAFTNVQWVQNFRMFEETLDFLCIKLRPVMERQNTTFRDCVPLKKRAAIALWKLATASGYRSIGHLFGVGITTVYRCVQEFCAAAETLLVPELIRFPDEERFREMAVHIENRGKVVECVYWTARELPGKPLLVTAGYYILGDSTYPFRTLVVENAFGRLKGQWHCVLKRNDCDIQLVKSMVLTCCALHNLCEDHGETYETSWDIPEAAAEQGVEEGGRDVRDGLMQYLTCKS